MAKTPEQVPLDERETRLIRDFARWFAPLMDASRPEVSHVRLIGTRRNLTGYATNGHVIARIVVKADFSKLGDRFIGPQQVLDCESPFMEPPRLRVLPRERGFLRRGTLDKVIPAVAPTSRPILGVWNGPVLECACAVGGRVRAVLTIQGNATKNDPILIYARDFQLPDGGWYADLDIAVMPARGAR